MEFNATLPIKSKGYLKADYFLGRTICEGWRLIAQQDTQWICEGPSYVYVYLLVKT